MNAPRKRWPPFTEYEVLCVWPLRVWPLQHFASSRCPVRFLTHPAQGGRLVRELRCARAPTRAYRGQSPTATRAALYDRVHSRETATPPNSHQKLAESGRKNHPLSAQLPAREAASRIPSPMVPLCNCTKICTEKLHGVEGSCWRAQRSLLIILTSFHPSRCRAGCAPER